MHASRASLATVLVAIALVAASCGGDSDPTSTAAGTGATTTTSAPAATTTTEALAQATPALVTFDGASCSVTGGPVEPGLSEISVLNTSSVGAEALLLKLNSTYTVDTLGGDVTAGRFDRWGLAGNDDPSGFDEAGSVRMPQNASEPTIQPFTATSGTWAVVCLDFLNLKGFLGSDGIEVS